MDSFSYQLAQVFAKISWVPLRELRKVEAIAGVHERLAVHSYYYSKPRMLTVQSDLRLGFLL